MDAPIIFCEGSASSLDIRLLARLMRGCRPALFVPVGGKHGLRAFIDGHLATRASRPRYLAFRDRDFDVEPPRKQELIHLGGPKPIFLTYRSCVESYLIDAELIDLYWAFHNENSLRWGHGGSPGRDAVGSWAQEAARAIADYQAARWALSKAKPSQRWPEVRNTWTTGSGDLRPCLSKAACNEKATSLVQAYTEVCSLVTVPKYQAAVERYEAQFASAEFWDNMQYMTWFHGKDLAAAMHRIRPGWISLSHFCSWAVDHAEWGVPVDLAELKARILAL